MCSFIRFTDVQKKLGVSRSKVYRLIEDGHIPKPIKLGRLCVWPEEELDKALLKLFPNEERQGSL